MSKLFLILVASVAALPAATWAADWQFEPRIELGGIYNDNYRLVPSGIGKIDVWGPQIDAAFAFHYAGPTTKVTVVPRLHSVYFPDHTDQDTNDQFLTFQLDHIGEKSTSGLVASYQREDTVNTEQPGAATAVGSSTDLGTIVNRDNGLITLRNRRELLRFQPGATYKMGARSDLELGASYEKATYADSLVGGQIDYQYYSGRIGIQFASTPTSVTTFRVLGSKYDPTQAFASAATYGGEIEWRKNVSASQQYYLRAGAANTRVDAIGTTPSSSETALVGGGGGRWLRERSNLFLDYVRDVVPNAAGTVVTRDELRLYIGRKLRHQVEAFVSGLGSRETQSGAGNAGSERKYAAVAVGFNWRYSREFSLAPRFEHRWQDYSGTIGAASGNSAYISFIYEPRAPVQ